MLSGKVVAVTGGGRGIGREIALLAAREGASVVVNDLGGSQDGEGRDAGPAEEVVAEIRAAGGQAIVNAADISDPAAAASIVEDRSEEHTSELQSLMRISYAVFCLKNK